jgi:hypothetical protein
MIAITRAATAVTFGSHGRTAARRRSYGPIGREDAGDALAAGSADAGSGDAGSGDALAGDALAGDAGSGDAGLGDALEEGFAEGGTGAV